jgi:hypothetical protein
MAGGTVPAGDITWEGTLGAGVVDTVVFTDRYSYFSVNNISGASPMFVTTDGSTPTTTPAGASNIFTVDPGATLIVSNRGINYGQVDRVVPTGSVVYPNGSGSYQSTPNGQPGKVHPYGSSLLGGLADPDATLNIISVTANAYTVTAVG